MGLRICFQVGFCLLGTEWDMLKRDDFCRALPRIIKGERTPPRHPAARFARIDDKGISNPPDFRVVGVAEDNKVVLPVRRKLRYRAVEVGDCDFFPLMGEDEGGLADRPERSDHCLQPRFFPVTIAENGFDGAPDFPHNLGGKRRDEIAGMDNEVASGVAKKPDRPPDRIQVVVRIRQDPDHEWIIPEPTPSGQIKI